MAENMLGMLLVFLKKTHCPLFTEVIFTFNDISVFK